MIFSGKIEKPKEMNEFNIPCLIKKTCYYSTVMVTTKWDGYTEAFTDGFFYMKDNKKYYRVKLEDKVSYFDENTIVFLSNADSG